jgi:integrase
MEEKYSNLLQTLNKHRNDVFSNLIFLNNVNSNDVSHEVPPYITQLALLPVSKKSHFSEMIWDYDKETSNRAASVSIRKVQLNFGNYKHIPLGVLTEIKCLFVAVYLSPKDFGARKNEIKPNYLIGIFTAGLAFLDFVFYEMESRLGIDYVKSECNKLSEISLLDFEEAANKTTLTISSSSARTAYRSFFDLLNSHKAKEDIGIECDVDYDSIKMAYERGLENTGDRKEERLPYLETKEFDLALKKGSFNVVSFLKAVGEKVKDPVMEKHYETLATKYEEFSYGKEDFEDYGAYRLVKKGYSLAYINITFPENRIAKPSDRLQLTAEKVIWRFKKKQHFVDSLNIAIKNTYYSALWVIGSLMGARPNVYSDLKIDSCLDLADNTFVCEEHKGRDNRWNLFNDRWVAIPIMIDALKVVELIGGRIFQNAYVFGSVFTTKFCETDKPMRDLSHLILQGFKASTGLSPKDVNSKLTAYVFRHSLAYQMYRADVGLPVISYQLKHVVSAAEALVRKGKVSQMTLGYGGIANQLTSIDSVTTDLRHVAELEVVKTSFDPNGTFMGGKAEEHISKIRKFFNGCMEAGYTEDEIFEAMVKQGLAIINVGSGYCFGGVEDYDESLPCIGGLRCNPIRCHNAIVTKANAPRWREIYLSNLTLVGEEGYEDRQDQIVEVIEESKRVLEYLGEELI